MAYITMGNLELGDVPRIAAILDRPVPVAQVVEYIESGADLFEIRGDCFAVPIDEWVAYVALLKREIAAPLLATIKENDRTRGRRIEMYEKVLPYVDAIDSDIETEDTPELMLIAEKKLKIISFHDFEKTPSDTELNSIISRAVNTGADIIKIATMAHSRDDVTRLLELTKHRPEPMVTIVMGDHGSIARVIAPLFGSLFAFAFTGKAIAPGQLSLHEMRALFKQFYPEI